MILAQYNYTAGVHEFSCFPSSSSSSPFVFFSGERARAADWMSSTRVKRPLATVDNRDSRRRQKFSIFRRAQKTLRYHVCWMNRSLYFCNTIICIMYALTVDRGVFESFQSNVFCVQRNLLYTRTAAHALMTQDHVIPNPSSECVARI